MHTDFSQGRVWKRIVYQAVPLTLAQLVQLLYNIVDRIYIGHMPGAGSAALTGVGLTFPVVTLIAAFTALFASGGTPLFSIARGAGEETRARRIMGSVCLLLLCASLVITVLCYAFRRPMMFLFGASESSYAYADAYLRIYLLGTPFAMLSTGLNGFISAQGFPRIGMLTTVIGAALNLLLDPLFIFALDMGVSGAALATVISQGVSCLWVLRFLCGRRAILPLSAGYLRISASLTRQICALGASGFIMQGTNCLVQIACNSTLHLYGGDLYVGLMTVINSVRSVLELPVFGLNNGAQPVLGFNYGAKKYGRVKEGIRFTAVCGTSYNILAWLLVLAFPHFLLSIFSSDPQLLAVGPGALHLYFFGFFFMSFQFIGQTTFQALGFARQAIFFSLLRKAVIVVPLTLLLPRLGFGVSGVFLAEPISNAIGGLACFVTMMLTVYRKLGADRA
ncbi:MAG: MATE family efflux transporter [Clostridia bacterium]|nr:MATE family efflux transporter [Clostridia bacterium]MBQ7051603.1 MATE family efflux transporter [Clostridia bacterium]